MPDPNDTTITGLLIAAIVALAGVIIVLFRLYVTRNKDTEVALQKKDAEIAAERIGFAKERVDWEAQLEKDRADAEVNEEKLRADYERHLKEKAESYACELVEMSDKFIAREDAMRKDFGDRVERISAEASRAASEQTKVLEKIFERFVGPRRQGSKF